LGRANIGAMALFGGWIGFLFIAMLYMQELRGWSPLQAGLAVLPAAVLVALLSTHMGPLVDRFGPRPLVAVGLSLGTVGYLLFLPIGAHTNYAAGLLPTFVLAGLTFALAFGSLSIAATNGIAPEEQGLAGGLLNTSFQFGGALMLAIVTAVNHSASHGGTSPALLLHGFRTAAIVSVIASLVGLAATVAPRPAWVAARMRPVEPAPGGSRSKRQPRTRWLRRHHRSTYEADHCESHRTA
jgi:MFS family permease